MTWIPQGSEPQEVEFTGPAEGPHEEARGVGSEGGKQRRG